MNSIPVIYSPEEQKQLNLIEEKAHSFLKIDEKNLIFLQNIGQIILKEEYKQPFLPPSFAFLKSLNSEEVGSFIAEMYIDRLLEINNIQHQDRKFDVFENDKKDFIQGEGYLKGCAKSFVATFKTLKNEINIDLLKKCNPYSKNIIGLIKYGFRIHHPKVQTKDIDEILIPKSVQVLNCDLLYYNNATT